MRFPNKSGRGGGRAGGGASRGRGKGRDDEDRPKTSEIYSTRFRKIFGNNRVDDDDDFDVEDYEGNGADDFDLDNLAPDVTNLNNDETKTYRSHQQENDDREQFKLQKKIDRKDSRKKAKVDAKENRIAAAQAWTEQCRRRKEEKLKQQMKEKEQKQREKQKLLEKQKKLQRQQLAQQKQKQSQQLAQLAGKKSVSFVAPPPPPPSKQQQQQPATASQSNPLSVLKKKVDALTEQQQQPPKGGLFERLLNFDPDAEANKKKQQQQDASSEAPVPIQQQQQQQEQKKYVVPALRKVSPSLSARVQRILNKLVLDNAGALALELIQLFESGEFSRNDVISATGSCIVNSSLGTAHLTANAAIAIATVVRAITLKCGLDVGATFVSRVASELRAAIFLGPDDPQGLHTQKFLEETERRGTHGAIMLGCLFHLSGCSAKLPLTFLHDATKWIRENASFVSAKYNNQLTSIAAACHQLLKIVGEKLHDMVPNQMNQWVNNLQDEIHQTKKQNSSSSSSANNSNKSPVSLVRLEVILSQAKQSISASTNKASANDAAGSRRQRQQQQTQDHNNVADSSSLEGLTQKAIDILVDVAKPTSTITNIDKRAWKKSFTTMTVPDISWSNASQPEFHAVRWWIESEEEKQKDQVTARSNPEAHALLFPEDHAQQQQQQNNNSKHLLGVQRKDLFALKHQQQQQNDDDEDDDDQENVPQEEQFEQQFEDDEDQEMKAIRKKQQIKELRTFETAASALRFVSERQRNILQILESAFDDGEACQRLMRHIQQNETSDVAVVIIQCCMQEATYNPFYSKIACRLLEPSQQKKILNKVRKAFQFSLWDKFGSFRIADAQGKLPDVASLINLSCFLVHLFAEDRFDLSVLRGLDLDISCPPTVNLLFRILFLRILLVMDFPQQIVKLLFGHHSAKKGKELSGSDVEEDEHGNIQDVAGANSVIKEKLRNAVIRLFDSQFVDEKVAGKWMTALLDVVAGTSLDEDDLSLVIEEMPRRIKVAKKALMEGAA